MPQEERVPLKWTDLMKAFAIEFIAKHAEDCRAQAHKNFLDLDMADLTAADFRSANLTRISLSGANLEGANFVVARMQECRFERADMQWSDFSDCELIEADFTMADMRGASLTEAKMHSADFTGALMSFAAASPPRPIPKEDVYLFVKRIDNSGVVRPARASPTNLLVITSSVLTKVVLNPASQSDPLDVPAILRRTDRTSSRP